MKPLSLGCSVLTRRSETAQYMSTLEGNGDVNADDDDDDDDDDDAWGMMMMTTTMTNPYFYHGIT